MSEFPLKDHSHNSEENGSHAQNGSAKQNRASSILDLLSPDDPLQKEMERLLANDPEFKHELEQVASHRQRSADGGGAAADLGDSLSVEDTQRLLRLEKENQRLRARVDELEQIVEMTTSQSGEIWQEQQREYEAMLEEKSEVIRSLYQKIQKLKEKYGSRSSGSVDSSDHPVAQSANGDNPLAVRQELAAMREQLERERMQLRQDEQALEEQMRQMEMSMSKERVELARQKNEIQRMYQELQHELDQADRNGDLRERLAHIQQQRRPDSNPGNNQFQPRRALPTQQALSNDDDESSSRSSARPKSTSFLGRMFGNEG